MFMNRLFFIPHMNAVFHVKLLNILVFVHLPEKVLGIYFEIKEVLALFSRCLGVELLSDFLTSQFIN